MRRLLPLLLLLALPACDLPDSVPFARDAPPPEPVVLERAWVRDDLTAVSRPTAVGGRVVLYTAQARQLMLTALDPADGRTVWSVPTTASAVTPGVELSVQHAKGLVVHMRRGPQGGGVVTAIDAATGRQKWTDTVAVAYKGQPRPCEDDTTVCGDGYLADESVVDVRLRLADGRRTQSPRPDEDAGRELGGDVRDTGQRDPELLEGRQDGRTTWTRPADDVFGAPVTSDNGWHLDRYDDVVAGSLGRRRPEPPGDRPFTVDLARESVLAGFSHATGENLWTDEDAVYRCNGAFDDVLVEGAHDVAYRCRYTGTATVDLAARRATLLPGVTAAVEGFDPRTGRTTWSADVTGLPVTGYEQDASSGSVLGLDDARLVLSDAAGRHVLLDLQDGTVRDAAPDTTGWCPVTGGPLEVMAGDELSKRNSTADHVVPCRADGEPVRVPTDLDHSRGAVVGDVIAWTTNAGVRAARQVSPAVAPTDKG